jgi:hypothetical protein
LAAAEGRAVVDRRIIEEWIDKADEDFGSVQPAQKYVPPDPEEENAVAMLQSK